MAQIKLGELLVRANVLQEGQLRAALAEQNRWGGKLGETLVRMGLVTEELLVRALSKQLGLPTVNLDAVEEVPATVRERIPSAVARDQSVLPLQLRDDGRTLVVVMSDPLNLQLQDDLRAITRCRIQVVLSGRSSIQRAYARIYQGEALPPDEGEDGSDFKVLDSQGRALGVERGPSERAEGARAAAVPVPPVPRPPAVVPAPPARPPPPPPARAAPPAPARPAAPAADAGSEARGEAGASQLLRGVEELQRREATALKALVELLIDKGIFSRDEYLSKVRR
jgi:hypothetical protein